MATSTFDKDIEISVEGAKIIAQALNEQIKRPRANLTEEMKDGEVAWQYYVEHFGKSSPKSIQSK